MKKIVCVVLGIICMLNLAAPAFAENNNNALKKLGRGACNIATCPLEVIEQMQRVNDTDGPLAGMTYGALKGIAMTFVRATVGVYEVLTFPIPLPKAYKPILTDPEFFFEDKSW